MSNQGGRVLVAEDDAEMRAFLGEALAEAGHEVCTAENGAAALEEIARSPVDVLITDQMMPGMRGGELLELVRAREPELPVVIITAFGSIDAAVEAVKAGAFHYLAKPFRIEQLLATLESALRERRLREQIRSLQNASTARSVVIAESPAMRRAVDLVVRAAAASSPVLLLGESGTGKEVLARLLHDESPRRGRPLVAVNCSAIPETLLESQLFGHRRGAFTDAREDRRGLFQEAEGGTVHLDEIGDMPLVLQAKLLRVLQEHEVHPVGAPLPVPVDVRIVAATHRDVPALVSEGRFRQDLFYRLNVISVPVPPLRERSEDLLPLAAHFLEKHGQRVGRTSCVLAAETIDAFRRYSWPGNVRELENAIERALVLSRDDVLKLADLPEAIRASRLIPSPGGEPHSLADMEREHIVRALRAAGNNKAAAARLLGLDRKTLYRKIRAYGLQTS